MSLFQQPNLKSLFTMIFPTIQLTIFRSILRQTAMKFFPTFFANKWKLLGPTTPEYSAFIQMQLRMPSKLAVAMSGWDLGLLRARTVYRTVHRRGWRAVRGEWLECWWHKKWKDTWTEISTVKLSPLQNLSFVLLPAQRRADFYFIVAARTLSFWSFLKHLL